MQAILAKKRRGLELTSEEVADYIQRLSTGKLHDAQIGAMLMATAINGMTSRETADLTRAMVYSGSTMKWSGIVADKHSTGGVGDKVSIPLAPILAELGLTVPMISGRGLEITGGTLDKLESIPGYKTSLTVEEMKACLEGCGCFIASATKDICPADKVTYAIRDVTSTVDSIPLIVGSILSKKIAEGAKFLVQDIKVGEAAFFKDVESAASLGRAMIQTAEYFGLTMSVILTRMDQPLGRAVGNSLEIEECIDILKGNHFPKDLMEVILTLGSELLHITQLTSSIEEGREKMMEVIKNQKALKRFEKMLILQGVSKRVAEELCYSDEPKVFPTAKFRTELKVECDGYIESISALKVGTIVMQLGGGRNLPEDVIDNTIGCIITKREGDFVKRGTCWAIIHHNTELPKNIDMNRAIKLSPNPITPVPVIIKKI